MVSSQQLPPQLPQQLHLFLQHSIHTADHRRSGCVRMLYECSRVPAPCTHVCASRMSKACSMYTPASYTGMQGLSCGGGRKGTCESGGGAGMEPPRVSPGQPYSGQGSGEAKPSLPQQSMLLLHLLTCLLVRGPARATPLPPGGYSPLTCQC